MLAAGAKLESETYERTEKETKQTRVAFERHQHKFTTASASALNCVGRAKSIELLKEYHGTVRTAQCTCTQQSICFNTSPSEPRIVFGLFGCQTNSSEFIRSLEREHRFDTP